MRRNARLALIEYYAAKPLPTDIGPRDLLSALLAYQNEHGTSPICFAGVRRAHCLSKPQQQEFLVEVTRYANTKTETEGDPEVIFHNLLLQISHTDSRGCRQLAQHG